MTRSSFGVVLIAVGCVFLLSALVPEGNQVLRLWPLLIIFYAAFSPRHHSAAYRLGLGVVGIILLATAFFPSFLDGWGWLWPLLLVILGLIILTRPAGEPCYGHRVELRVRPGDGASTQPPPSAAAPSGEPPSREQAESAAAIELTEMTAGESAPASHQTTKEPAMRGTADVRTDYSGQRGHFYAAIPEGAAALAVQLSLSAGRLQLSGTTEHLFELDIEEGSSVEPEVRLSEELVAGVKTVRLSIFQDFPGARSPFKPSTSWRMKLNPRLRLDFDGDINASRASLDFTELKLAALNLDNNAAATEVRVGTLSDEVDIRADNNAAKLTLSLPRDFGCEAKIQSAVSKHNAHELMPRRVGDRWFSEGFADSPRKVRLHIEANASKVDFTTD